MCDHGQCLHVATIDHHLFEMHDVDMLMGMSDVVDVDVEKNLDNYLSYLSTIQTPKYQGVCTHDSGLLNAMRRPINVSACIARCACMHAS